MDCAALLSLFLPLATALPPPADLSAPSFRRLAAAGTATNRWIELRGRTFSLRDEFSIPTGRALRIRGPGHIIGDSHSLFKLAGRSCLECETGVRLSHRASPQRAHRRELGAAVFALGKSHVLLRNVSITSERGFGVWMVQRARVELMDGSDLHHCGRSAIVAFGKAQLSMVDSSVRRAHLHGVCARGDSQLLLRRTRIEECGVRGCYAYHNASLELQHCTLAANGRAVAEAVADGLARRPTATLQVEALRREDRARLRVEGCRLVRNVGDGLRVAGHVELHCDGLVHGGGIDDVTRVGGHAEL